MAKKVCCEVTHQGATLVRSHDVCDCLFSLAFISYIITSAALQPLLMPCTCMARIEVFCLCRPVWIHKHALNEVWRCAALQKGQKTDVVSVLVRLEFADRIVGESAKVECSADQETSVNYSVSLPVAADDAVIVDELASKPLLCTLPFLHRLLYLGSHYFKILVFQLHLLIYF